jgi:hypothetical protein
MTDLKIDYQLLDQISASLSSLAAQFENIQATQDGYNGAMGSDLIAGAMNGFAGNWSIHRKKLLDSMLALQQHAHGIKQGFSSTDEDLRHQLAGKTK